MNTIKNNHPNFIRQKAQEILYFLGIYSPNKKQLQAVEKLVRCWVIPVTLCFKEHLTLREQDCLWYAAKGFSVAKTADMLGIRHTTVKRYRENILRKTQCHSILAAIIKLGYLANADTMPRMF